jgi:hypothetical protein
LDPKAGVFPWVSPYNYAENRPIDGIDLWGLQYLQYSYYEVRHELSKTGGNLKEFDKGYFEPQKKVYKYTSIVSGMATLSIPALILGPTVLGLNIVKDVLPENEKAQESPKGPISTVGRGIDEAREKNNGVESELFEQGGELIEAILLGKDIVKKPKNIIEVLTSCEDAAEIASETTDVVIEVQEEITKEETDEEENIKGKK